VEKILFLHSSSALLGAHHLGLELYPSEVSVVS